MAKVYIELDYEVVEKAIAAKVPAAVEDVLRRYDLQRIIEAAITSDKKPAVDPMSHEHYTMLGFGFREPASPRERFEATLNAAIAKALESEAKKILQSNPELLRPAVERAIPAAIAKVKFRLESDDDDDD